MNNYYFPILTDEINLPLYVKGVGGLDSQDQISRPNGYNDFHWLHCIKGKGQLTIGGKDYILSKNSGFYMNPGMPHEYKAIEEPWSTRWITFDGQSAKSILETLGFNKYNIYHFDDIRPIDSIILDIYNMPKSSISSGYKRSAKLYTLLIEIENLKRQNEEKSSSSKLKKLQPLLNFLEENYSKNPTIEDMASTIGVSPQYLCRIFNNVLSTRPITYLNKFKLQKAKEILLYSEELSIKDVSEKVGFNDPSYFSSIFKKLEGTTPAEFRALHKIV